MKELKTQSQSLREENYLIKAQKQQLLESIQIFQQRIRAQETDIQNLQQRIHAQETDKQNLQQRIRAQQKDNQNLQQRIHSQVTDNQNLQQIIRAQETDNQDLQQRIHSQATDSQNLLERICAQETDNQNLQQRLHAQETELQNLRQERQDYQRLLQHQQQQIYQLQQTQRHNTLQQQQSWIVNRNEISLEEKELGRGAYGWVKQATFCGCKVAVKCLHNELISEYNLHVFGREMTMSARCRHPNLLQFIGATNEGVPLIVTEMMHTSLRKVLESGQLSSDQIIPIAAGVACGLNYLHKTTPSPILHRDVSSANVLLNPLPGNQWLPKLSDFGSLNFMRESQTLNPGNPVYAAPEALDPSKGPHTPAMDTFSFGVLLYEMCSRRLPTGVFSVSMLQRLDWRVPETNTITLIEVCVNQVIQRRPSMDRVIAQLNSLV